MSEQQPDLIEQTNQRVAALFDWKKSIDHGIADLPYNLRRPMNAYCRTLDLMKENSDPEHYVRACDAATNLIAALDTEGY